MPVKEIGDPRLQALFGTTDPRDAGVRPTVRLPRKALPPASIAAVMLVIAILLFALLNSRRTHPAQPSVEAVPSDGAESAWSAPPPLYVPPLEQPAYAPPEQPRPAALPPVAHPAAPLPAPHQSPPPVPVVQTVPQVIVAPAPAPPPPQRVSSGAPLVIDAGSNSAAAGASGASTIGDGGDGASRTVTRMQASAFANRSMTVPQGYLIPAVLETGFDSTKPGYARAIVSRDVHGFDGKYILIPRGSRLIGEYKSAIAQGQNRAIIAWTRLIRPDGMTIMMDAPAVDPSGRSGVPASVNSHFLARLGDALLQSTFQIGGALAGRAARGPVVILSGSATNTLPQVASAAAAGTNYVPTLKVAPGKSISIFVAQDLDFSSAGASR